LEENIFYLSSSFEKKHLVNIEINEKKAIFFIEPDPGEVLYVSPSNFGCVLSHEKMKGDSLCNVERVDDDFLYFNCNGLYLSGNPDYTVDIKIYREKFEKFFIVEDYSTICEFLKNKWHIESLNIVLSGEECIKKDFKIEIQDIEIDMGFFSKYSFQSRKNEIIFFYDKYKVELLKKYRPAIYFATFGDQNSFDMLSNVIFSLEKFGKFDGDYIILTNKKPSYIWNMFPNIDKERIKISYIPVCDVIDMVSARFKIYDIEFFENYSPIVYMDCDIVCNSDLRPFLTSVLKAEEICVKLEGPINEIHYGSNLISDDKHYSSNENRGFNSGVIAFSRISVARSAFRATVNSLYAHINSGLPRSNTEAYDQPVANYVFSKIKKAMNYTICEKFVHPWPSLKNEEILGIGLIHFCGGVGFGHKVDRINSYYTFIENSSKIS